VYIHAVANSVMKNSRCVPGLEMIRCQTWDLFLHFCRSSGIFYDSWADC